VKSLRGIAAAGLLGLVVSGCTSVGPEQQRLVSKPNMQVSRKTVFNDSLQLMPQIQPGLATTAGAQASTCSLCR